MTQSHIEVGIVVERRTSASPWADHRLDAARRAAGAAALAPWTELPGTPERRSFYLGPAVLTAALGRHRAFPREFPAPARPKL